MEREMGLAGFGWDRVPPVKMVGLISEHRPNNSAGHDDDVNLSSALMVMLLVLVLVEGRMGTKNVLDGHLLFVPI